MLVLSRRPGEAIRIGDDIVIKVVAAGSGQVRIGIEAPRHVRVLREEVHGALAAANEEASRRPEAALVIEVLTAETVVAR